MSRLLPIFIGFLVGNSIVNLIQTHDTRWWTPLILGIFLAIASLDFGGKK